MFWGDSIIDDFLAQRPEVKKKKKIVLRDEKTMSGKPHVGSMRSFVMHAIFSDVLTSRGLNNTFYYELNDMDAFDSVPTYVPAEWKKHLGKRLKDVPSPDGKAKNYPTYFADEYTKALRDSKYNSEFYYLSPKYEAGEFDKYIALALDHKDDIRRIYKGESGSDKPETWYPCQIVCEKCGKVATTNILTWDGKEVTYECSGDVGYTKGCGYRGKRSPFGGNATMPWKVEWAAKFCVMNVDLEGAGKDHYAAGGSRHVSNRICKEIFKHKPPFDVRHEFILIDGAKMSSSSGIGAFAADLEKIVPTYIFRFMIIQKEVMKAINFSPDGDTIPVLFDQYDEVCRDYFEGSDEVKEHKNRIFELTHFYEKNLKKLNRFLPRFSLIAFYVQMPHIDIQKKVEELKGAKLTAADKAELELRIEYAEKWLATSSPEKYIFKIQDEVPKMAAELNPEQKKFLGVLADFLRKNPNTDGGEIQEFIHEKKEETGMTPTEIFKAIYISLLGKDSGPKAGWLMEALDNKFLLTRFNECSKQ